jgi:sortase (surface protein transpeptidase)
MVMENTQKNKFQRFLGNQNPNFFWSAISILSLSLILVIILSGVYFYDIFRSEDEVVISDFSPPLSSLSELSSSSQEVETPDLDGQIITTELKKAGIDIGFISSKNILELGLELPFKSQTEQNSEVEYIETIKLDNLIKPDLQPQKKNLLIWEQYGILAPIQWASFDDFFGRDDVGNINFKKQIDNDPIDSPVQVKLKDGVVHLPFSPLPGEVGNSYIVGHSSNFLSVKSQYNEVFKPIERVSKPGEEFFIYDNEGRELKFRVFEAIAVGEADRNEAYKKFGDRRVVTLQASILERVGKNLLPTKRWLTRAELVIN